VCWHTPYWQTIGRGEAPRLNSRKNLLIGCGRALARKERKRRELNVRMDVSVSVEE
jgi:hypothetical protein